MSVRAVAALGAVALLVPGLSRADDTRDPDWVEQATAARRALQLSKDRSKPVAGNAGSASQAGDPADEPRESEDEGSSKWGSRTGTGGKASRSAFTVTGPPSVSGDFINFAYLQNSGVLPHIRWNALTHIGNNFTNFNSTGGWVNLSSWTGRDASLKAGGAADNAGVKVIMVVLNDGFNSSVTNSVMQNATYRTTLVNNVVSAVTSDAYCQGVSFDFEPFSYGTATRDGMVLFFDELRDAFDVSSKPDAEISLYTDATYSSSNYNLPGLVPNIDYFNYSCYDWATGSTAHAVSDADNYISRVNTFLNNGIPANKMVLLESSYGGDWPSMSAAAYNATGGSRTAIGFCDGLFDTTLNTANGGPFTANYQTGDEAGWYAYVSGTQHVATWEDPRAAEYKARLVTSFPDSGNTNSGKRLRGIGWWSLYWFANFGTSYNPLPPGSPQGNTSKTRTYPQIYQICQEVLKTPGVSDQVFEKFEQDNPRWASFASTQNSSPDNTNWTSGSTTKGLVSSPSGAGAPINSTKAMGLHFAYSGSSAGKIFFRHEVLKDNVTTSIVDTNAMAAKFDANNAVNASIYSVGAYTGVTVRLVVMDKNRQLEASPAYAMNSVGWRLASWDLTDTTGGNVTGLTTAEPAFVNGNGVIDTAGAGARDIGFVGFLVEKAASGTTAGDLYFDELSYSHRNPGGKNYKINEFRYTGNANEFVEIHGPAGSFPTNLELRFYNPANGAVLSSVALGGQTVAGDSLFVVGDPNVPNKDYTPGAWLDTADNIAGTSTQPGAAQLYDAVSGCVYDSVVWQAYGGLGDLIRQETNGVTAEGYPWIGEVSSGGDASGAGHSAGRYPDGTDTNINYNDFSQQRATPGTANGALLALPALFDFESAPSNGAPFNTFGTYAVTTPPVAIANDGNAYRCVDTTGGGAMMFIGDASLGSDGLGYNVSGEIYVQPDTARAAAQGVGFCGTQGSRFFTNTTNNIKVSSYESGYWIVFENKNGLGLNEGQADHGGVFHFYHATNDNMDDSKTTLLGSASLAALGLSSIQTTGGWTSFMLYINPNAGTNDRLIAKVNDVEVYHGAIPANGPTKGGFMAGYREATGGTFATTDGNWIDNLVIASSATPAAPSGLSATTISQTQINLAWTDNSNNETGFIIGRGTASGGPYTDIQTVGAGVTSFNNTGLTANTAYYYVVSATNLGIESANTSEATATTLPNAPTAPSGLSATTISQTQINIAWTDNSSNETGFIIGRSTTNGGPYTDIQTVGAGVTTFNNTGLTANTAYYYVVRATNSGGDSANTAQATATTLPNAPTAPSGLSATTISQTQINLAWTDNSSNETGFIIGRSTTNGGPYTDIQTVGAGVTSFNNTGLTANTTYYYVVRATNSGGDSANTAQATATTLPNAPTAPSGLSATTISQTQINLAWTDNSSNETGFIIGRSTTNGGPYTDIQTVGAGVTSFNNTGLTANTAYYYVVRATNSGGDSANTAQATATTLPNAPAAPSGLSATTISQTQINLAWTDNSSNETGFIIGRSTTNGGPYTDIQTVGAGVTTFNNTGLTANTAYYYVVRATNSGGDSANTAQATATTLPNAPTAPSGLSATAASQSQINLSWTDNSSNETGFVIGRSQVTGGPYTDIQTVGAGVTSYSDTGLNASTPYFYVVRATNTGGNSANSSQATATTLQADRIVNGSFENGFTSGVGNGWTSWTAAGSAAFGFGQASVNKKDGSYSQYWNRADTALCDGGVYQTFATVPGGTYQINGWMKRQSTFTGSFIRVGYDLTGGTSGTGASVTYTDITGTNDTWNQYTASVVATGSSITVFARGGHTSTSGGTNAYYYFDAITVVGPGPSLATNGSFENGFTAGVGNNWTSFTTSGTPSFGQASTNKHDGSYSQYWNRADTAAFDGGVRQTITVTPGQTYTISAWMKRQSTFTGTTMRFGYDLTGGTSATAGSVVYTDITGGTNNVWVQYAATVTATGSSITLFGRGGHTGTTGGSTAYFYLDEVKLYVP